MKVHQDFNRLLLKQIHRDAKRKFPNIDLRKALGTHKQPHGRWLVEGTVGGKYRSWHGRAEDANHAKYEAWKMILSESAS